MFYISSLQQHVFCCCCTGDVYNKNPMCTKTVLLIVFDYILLHLLILGFIFGQKRVLQECCCKLSVVKNFDLLVMHRAGKNLPSIRLSSGISFSVDLVGPQRFGRLIHFNSYIPNVLLT